MKKDKRSKEEQLAMAEYLTKKFAEIDSQQELIPVVMQRGEWEALSFQLS